MSALIALVAAFAFVAAHLRERGRAPSDPAPALRVLVPAALATWLLGESGGWTGIGALRLPLLGAALVTALLAWSALCALLAMGWRRRDLWLRIAFLLPALVLIARGSASGATALLGLLAVLAWRWKTTLPTRRRFSLAMGALALGGVLAWVHPLPHTPLDAYHGLTRGLRLGELVLSRVIAGYALIGSLVLLRAWVRDPSLGIRAVNRRLALSHVLVGLVPLLLLGGLWASTTFLGVLNERAIVGSRALAESGRGLEQLVRAALTGGGDTPARLRDVAGVVSTGPGARAWWRGADTLQRVAGDPIAGEHELGGWLDSLDRRSSALTVALPGVKGVRVPRPPLPHSGVLRLGDSLFLAAAVRAPGGNGAGAVLAVPLRPVLAALGDSVARARLEMWGFAITQRGPVSFSGDDEAADSAAADSLASAIIGRVPGETREQRRARVARTLRTMSHGARDTAAAPGRMANRPRTTVVAEGDTLGTLGDGRPGGAFLLQGHALALGLQWNPQGWRRTRFMMTASEDPWRVASGMVRDVRTDPMGVIPLLMVGFFTVLALIVLWWDLSMVTGMGRSIAEAVGALRDAATRFAAGDLSHRIAVKGDDDLWQVAGAFNQAAVDLEKARAAERERQRIENELDVARRIQTRLLPSEPPRVEGLEVAGRYEPAREVGGDYYDHIALDAHRVLLVIADVSGKSVPAALIMSGFRAALVSQDLGHAELSPLAERLNEFLNSSLDPGKFVTAFLAVLDGRDGSVSYVNAGHNPPVLMRADGHHELLEEGGTILGILPMSRYAHGAVTLAPGDLLVLYTDGVTEGARADGEQWGEERLTQALADTRGEGCAAIAARVARAVREFEGEAGATDDVTLVVARRI